MPWNNRDLLLYHGTDSVALSRLTGLRTHHPVPGFVISLSLCRPHTDFGQGFYTTTSDYQARQWANATVRRTAVRTNPPAVPLVAVVLRFQVRRDWLAGLEQLCFVRATGDFYDLVDDCRAGFRPHGRTGTTKAYDVVYGPVRIGLQRLIIQDCDQVSFHSGGAVAHLGSTTYVHDIATAGTGGLFPP